MADNDSLQKNQDQNTMNVVQPQSIGNQGQQAPQGPQMPETSTGGGGAGSAMAQDLQAPASSQDAPQRGGAPSSGMYTNLRSYMQANRGAGDNLREAAQKQTDTSAQNIRQQVEQAQRGFGTQVEGQQQRLGQERDFAKQTVQQIAGTTPQPTAAQQNQVEATPQQPEFDANQFTQSDDFNRFRNIITGQTTFGEDMRAEEFSPQAQAARQLAQQVQGLRSQEGRADALRNAFSNREYTRGQSGLDNLLLQSDAGAVQSLIDNTQGAVDQTQTGIQDARQQAINQLAGLREESRGLAGDITSFTQEQDQMLEQQALEQARQQRQAMIDQLVAEGATGEQVDQFIRQAGMDIDPLTNAMGIATNARDIYGGRKYGRQRAQAAINQLNSGLGQDDIYQTRLPRMGTMSNPGRLIDNVFTGDIEEWRHVNDEVLGKLANRVDSEALNLLGTNFNKKGLVTGGGGSSKLNIFDTADRFGQTQQQLMAERNVPEFIQEVFAREQGMDQDQVANLFSTEGITDRGQIDDVNQRARLNALTQLIEGTGSQNLISGREGAGSDSARLEAFNQDLLRRIGAV